MLKENIECVAALLGDFVEEHIISVDYRHEGVAENLNRLWPKVTTEWIQILSDDDLLDPYYFTTMFAEMEEDDDVLYAQARVTGHMRGPHITRGGPPSLKDLQRNANVVGSNVLLRTALAHKVGGYGYFEKHEDTYFHIKALEAGAKYHFVDAVLKTYRFHGGNRSLNHGISS
jgi:GT2 family glycosyltransferase